MTARRAAAIGLRVAVIAAAIVFLARGVRWGDVSSSIARASAPLLVIVVALNGAMLAVKAVRLRLLLAPADAPVVSCLGAIVASSALNNVTPLRGGDLARLWMLERAAGVGKGTAAAIAIVEKILELATLGAIAAAGAFASSSQGWARVAAPVVVVAASCALAAIAMLTRHPRLARLEPGTRALRHRRRLAAALGLSFAAWLIEIVMLLTCAHAVGLPLSPALAAVCLLGVNLAIALPSAPASAGAFESALVVVLALAGVGKSDGLGFALMYHAVQVVPVTLVGLVWAAAVDPRQVAPPRAGL